MTWFRRILLFMFFLALSCRGVFAQTSPELIRSFKTDTQIVKDGTIQLTETIVYDFDNNQKHGIFRTIPYTKTNAQNEQFAMKISGISVTDEKGNSYNFTKTDDGSSITVKIGDANRTITGIHTYIITYTVSGALTYFLDHDELYWNTTGNAWTVPIQAAVSTVTLPKNISASQVTVKCFSGVAKSISGDCGMLNNSGGTTFTMKHALLPREGMTFVLGFSKGIVAVLEPAKIVNLFDTVIGKILALIIMIALFFWYFGLPVLIPLWWFFKGRDPKPTQPPLRVSFDPPTIKNGRALMPGEIGTLIDESADMQDISATIVSLAQRKYLMIEEKKKNDFYFIQKKDPNDSGLLAFEKILLTGIFSSGQEVRVKDMAAYEMVEETKTQLYQQVMADGFFVKNPQTQRTIWKIFGIFTLLTVNIIVAVEAFIFGRNMARKTQAGADAAASAQSLRTFLVSQERQLNFQGTNQMMFEKLLSYAIAFGVEKQWAKRFEKFNLTAPDWYRGYDSNPMMNMVWLSGFSHSMSSFASSAAPPVSSSGFSSGFSGGSSGGGGGGGGGGSW